MRRRRHRLQVSTFPFLAVLLCAMGSLILLLLVLDRRAKVVARAKERERQEAVIAQHSKADQERIRAYEQKRQELRKQLQAQEAALHAKVDTLQTEIRKKKQQTLEERSRTVELQARLAALREVLAREQAGYEQEKQQSASLTARKRTVLSEHEALARELVNLENALADVIAFRKRQAQTYSLVPFLGKSGENRRPIYVECQADQIIVHPEHMIAKTSSWDGTSPVQELAEKLAARLKANADETKQKPYVLFLIRPEGIGTYYRVLGALGVQSIDSGYELIDADWALDFGESDSHAPAQPWAADPRTPTPRTLAGSLPPSQRLTGPVRGVPQNSIELSGKGGTGSTNTVARPEFGVAPADRQKGQPVNGYGTGAIAQSVPGRMNGRPGAPVSLGDRRGDGPGQEIADGAAPQGLDSGSANFAPGAVAGGRSGVGDPAMPNGTGTGNSGGGMGPSSLSDLLQSQDGSGRRASGRTGEKTTAASGASSPSVPGSGVSMPGPGGQTGGPAPNTADSRVAFTETGQRVAGGIGGEPKLLPLPGSNEQSGSLPTPLTAGSPRTGPGDSPGPGATSDGPNSGSGGYSSSGGGAAGPGGFGSNGTGVLGGYSAKLPNPGAEGETASGQAGPAGSGASQPGSAPVGDLANNLPPTGPGTSPPGAAAPGQSGGGLSLELGSKGARPARPEAQDGELATSSTGPSSGTAGSNQGSVSGNATGDGVGVSGPPGPPDPLAHLLPKTRRPPAPAAFRMEGNRDLPIVLECRADEVVMTANGRQWQVADLERDAAARTAFMEVVQQWIARRQATVREGQTPYRPQVRFRVNPDGLRTYYAAYPALEKLGYPMKRENVEALPPPAPRVRPE